MRRILIAVAVAAVAFAGTWAAAGGSTDTYHDGMSVTRTYHDG